MLSGLTNLHSVTLQCGEVGGIGIDQPLPSRRNFIFLQLQQSFFIQWSGHVMLFYELNILICCSVSSYKKKLTFLSGWSNSMCCRWCNLSYCYRIRSPDLQLYIINIFSQEDFIRTWITKQILLVLTACSFVFIFNALLIVWLLNVIWIVLFSFLLSFISYFALIQERGVKLSD